MFNELNVVAMKSLFKTVVLINCFLFFINSNAQDVEHIMCNEYWTQVDLTSLALSKSFFDLRGQNDICNLDTNERYPYDERISIRIYNHFNKEGAVEEYNNEKSSSESLDGYRTITDLGDDAFAIVKVQFGRLNSAIIEVVKGTITIHFDINGNAANNSNNRFTDATVIDFVKAIVEPL